MQYFKRRFKMGRFIIALALTAGLIVFLTLGATAQTTDSLTVEKTKLEPFSNVSFASQYVWRGVMLDGKPNIQPLVGLAYGGLEVGAFGSLSTLNSYAEVDLYASYKYKCVKLTLTDFYVDLSGPMNDQKYFNYSDTMGYHNLMVDISIGGSEKFPILFTASTIVYGGWDLDTLGKSNYTTYLEARYLNTKFEAFVGVISGQSAFYLNDQDEFGLLNVGVLYKSAIKFKDFELPVATQFCVNPQMEKVYLTFVLTL
jgi:hypothetical protein